MVVGKPPGLSLSGSLLQILAPEPETRCQQALTIAQRRQARALELRAAMSLGQLWQRQGRYNTARDLLTPLYGWCTEGCDTVDLQEARGLLEIWQ